MALLRTSAMLVLLLTLLSLDPTPAFAKWQTLHGQAPLVIANGGLSGLYPDQTSTAYYEALYQSLPGVILSCDLQLAPDPADPRAAGLGVGICRTNINLGGFLGASTNIAQIAPQLNSTYVVNKQNLTGYYAIDIPVSYLIPSSQTPSNQTVAFATQSNGARSEQFDGLFPIAGVLSLPGIIAATPAQAAYSTWWLNSQYTQFIETNSNLNATLYLIAVLQQYVPGYVSVSEISLLKAIQASPNTTLTKAIYKFLDSGSISGGASSNDNQTALLSNLTYIKTLAAGILVPKSLIWPIDQSTFYLLPPTTLVEDAHKVGLEVYAYGFANDQYPNSNNYTFDSVTEILYFTENSYNFSVDGIFTDFPVTASEAISCYATNSRNSSVSNKQPTAQKTVISHNGNSGQYPGATSPAYYSAITAGVDYIDCVVQISKDSVPFCRPTPNLIDSTDASSNSNLSEQYLTTYPGFYDNQQGIFTFDLTWDQISTLRANMYSPYGASSKVFRDINYNGLYGIIALEEFLSIAKNNSQGALIGIQNAVYIRDQHNIAVVDAVVAVLSAAGYNSTDKVIMQSSDSSVLARLRDLNITYPLMYEVIYDDNSPISLNATDLMEIKQYASMVNFAARLVEPFDGSFFLRTPPTDVIGLAKAQNLTTFFEVQQNEWQAFAFDLEADPTLQLYSLVNNGIDGFVTDYPITVQKYQANQCLGSGGVTASTVNYTIQLVARGALDSGQTVEIIPSPAIAPYPDLVVTEPPLAGFPAGVAPAPSTKRPASASQISSCFLLAAAGLVLYALVVV